ncbi:MAG: serine/threonine protein kinase, partial [Proteobacteria bacterium]|nr:serine/threonine protein kinase [Pseudomonadota bacterium]
MDIEPGAVIDGRYRIEAPIGSGGMASVFRVRHLELDTLLALKVLQITTTSIRARLIQEGRVQAALRHPNIVAVTDTVSFPGGTGLVMEYIRGPSLYQMIRKRKLTFEQVDAIAQGIMAGMAFAHEHELIHRDLKPANVLLSVSSQGVIPKIADFGLVKVMCLDESPAATQSGVSMGTPAYMAPEQIRDAKNVDHRADVFSLGTIFYELVSGKKAFDSDNMASVFWQVLKGDCVPIKERVPDLPERMERAIVGAMEVEVNQRVPDVHTLLALWRGDISHYDEQTEETGPWDQSFLAEASDLGAGGTPVGMNLRRSGSGVPASTTIAPMLNDRWGDDLIDSGASETFPPDASSIRGRGATEPVATATIPDRPEEPLPKRSQRAVPIISAIAGILLLVLICLTLFGPGIIFDGASNPIAPPDQPPPTPAATTIGAVPEMEEPEVEKPIEEPVEEPEPTVDVAPVPLSVETLEEPPVVIPRVEEAPPSRPFDVAPAITHEVVISSIPMGALVFVDGEPAGKTPIFNHRLVAGGHEVRLELGDLSIEREIKVGSRYPDRFVWRSKEG